MGQPAKRSDVDHLVRMARFAADEAALKQHRTDAEKTGAIVAAVVEHLIGNGFIEITDRESWPMWVKSSPPYDREIVDG